MESQHSVGVPTSHDVPQLVIISQLSRPEVVDDVHAKVGLFGKRPLTGKFSQTFSQRVHHLSDPHLVGKFCEIWLTRN